jgi:hypothetical protein
MVGQAVQEAPHDATEVSETHAAPQTCDPDGQSETHAPDMQSGAPPSRVGHTAHETPQAFTSFSARHWPPQRLKPTAQPHTFERQASLAPVHMPHDSTEREFPQLSKAMRLPQFLFCR